MTVYLIAEVTVTDDAWIAPYAEVVHDIAARHGGRFLSRSGHIETLEGEPRDVTLMAVLAFPSRDAALGFVNDPDYAPHARARKGGSVSHFRLIDDTDAAGRIPYLPMPA